MGKGEMCEAAARAKGLGPEHSETCEDRKHGCPGCPFEPRTLREAHDASCREAGMTEAEIEADWEAFVSEYDAILDERRAREDAEDPRFGADAGRDEMPEDLDEGEEEEPPEGDEELVGALDDSMDGDAESALASAGFGTDEDYGKFDGGGEYFDETPLGHECEGE